MDTQDALLFAFSLLGVLGPIALAEWRRPAYAWVRVLIELIWIFLMSSGAQYTGRVYFGAARGVDFTRVFIYASLGFVIYILARLYQDKRGHTDKTKETA